MSKTDQFIEKIEDFFSIYRERVKSPFGGTFLICWLLSHWPLIYAILAFDDGTLLHYKIIFIKSYLGLKGWWGMIWQPALLTLISFVVFTLINLLFIGITSAVRYLVKPKVIEITSRKKGVVEKDRHMKAQSLIKTLTKDLSDERETTLEFNNRIQNVYNELGEEKEKLIAADKNLRAMTAGLVEQKSEQEKEKIITDKSKAFQTKWESEIANLELSRSNALRNEFPDKWARLHGQKNVLGGTDSVYDVFYIDVPSSKYFRYTENTKATASFSYDVEVRHFDSNARFIWFTLTPPGNQRERVDVKLIKMGDGHWEGYEIAQNMEMNFVIYFSPVHSGITQESIQAILNHRIRGEEKMRMDLHKDPTIFQN